MSDLQVALLIIGAVVIGVIAYNRVQERRFRRREEASLGGAAGDALLEAVVGAARRIGRTSSRSCSRHADPDDGSAARLEPVAAGRPRRTRQGGESIPDRLHRRCDLRRAAAAAG